MRKECEEVDARHRMILDDYLKYKKQHQEMLAEIDFLEAQVNQSQLNDWKLKIRH